MSNNMLGAESFLNCAVCRRDFFVKDANHIFKNRSRVPMILHCGHNICLGCLKSASRYQPVIKCTVCQQNTVTTSNLEGVPVDCYLLGSLVKNREKDTNPKIDFQINLASTKQGAMPASVSQDSDVCVECQRSNVAFDCTTCENFFCRKCFNKVHSSALTLRSHEARPVLSVMYHPLQSCKEHNRIKDFCCLDDNEVICPNCAVVDHKGHNVGTVFDKNVSSVKDIEVALPTADGVAACLKASGKKLKNLLHRIESETKNHISVIRSHFQHLHSSLQLREQNLLHTLNECTRKHCTAVQDLLLHVDMEFSHVQTYLMDGKEQLINPSRLVNPDWLNELLGIKSLPCFLPLQEDDILSETKYFPKVCFPESLLQHLASYGELKTYEGQEKSTLKLIPFQDVPQSVLNEIINSDDTSSMPDLEDISNSTDSFNSIVTDTRPITVDQSCSHVYQNSKNESLLPKAASQPLRNLVAKPRNWTACKQELVKVSHIVSPHEFYIHRQCDAGIIKQLENTIRSWCRKKKMDDSLSVDVKEDKVYLVYQNATKSWRRARVTRLNLNSENECLPVNCISIDGQQSSCIFDSVFKVEIFYIDYGHKEIVQSTKLWFAPPQVLSLPAMALKCSLWRIEPINKVDGWLQDAITSFSSFVCGKMVEMTIFESGENDTLFVDLGEAERTDPSSATPLSIRDALVFLEYGYVPCTASCPDLQCTDVVPSVKFNCYFEPTLPAKNMTLTVYVSHIESPLNFFIQPVESCMFLTDIMHEMQNTYLGSSKSLPPLYGPYVGMPCAALYSVDEQWYRAEIVNLKPGRQLEVSFIDFGNREVASYTDVKRLHHKFMKFPKMAMECKLADVQLYLTDDDIDGDAKHISEEVKKFFHNQVYMKHLSLKVEDIIGNKQLLVSLFCEDNYKDMCVNALLVEKGYAISTGPCSYLDVNDEKHEAVQNETMVNVLKYKDGVADCSTIVHISHVVSPERIFVQLASTLPKLKMFMHELQQSYSSNEGSPFEQICSDFNVSTLYCAYDKVDNRWCRVKLQGHINNGDYEVLLIDYGKTVVLKKCHIHPLLDQFTKQPNFAHECCLVGIAAPGGSSHWPSIVIEFLQEVAQNHTTIYLKKMGSDNDVVWPVELFYEEITVTDALGPTVTTYISLANLLVEKGYALPAKWRSSSGLLSSIMPCINEDSVTSENSTKSGDLLNATMSDICPNETQHWFKRWKVPECSLYVGQKLAALPTYVNYDCDIYMHDVQKGANLLDMIKCGLTSKFENTTPQPHDLYWHVGESCVAQFAVDNHWYRGEVKEVDLEKRQIKVLFIDYGNEEYVNTEHLRKDVIFMDFPQQVWCCNLHNVKPVSEDGKWSTKAVNFVRQTVMGKPCHVIVKTLPEVDQNMTVSLMFDDSTTLEQVLVEMGCARFEYNENKDSVSVVNDEDSLQSIVEESYNETFAELKMPPLGEVFGIEVTEISGPNLFYVQRRACDDLKSNYQREINADCEALNKYSEMMNSFADSWPLVTHFQSGMPCCAQYTDDSWFRACILDYVEQSEQMSVFYVDYGNEETVPKARVRQLPSQFLELPKQAFQCTLHQVTPVNGWEDVQEQLKSIYETMDRSLFIQIKETGFPLQVDLLRSSPGTSSELTELAYQHLIDCNLLKLVRRKAPDEFL